MLEASIVRLRAQVERGETTRQNLEYELTLAKKATNQVRRIAAEKDSETLNNMGLLKDQLSQAQTRLASVEQELANAKNIRKNEAGQWKKHLQTKVTLCYQTNYTHIHHIKLAVLPRCLFLRSEIVGKKMCILGYVLCIVR